MSYNGTMKASKFFKKKESIAKSTGDSFNFLNTYKQEPLGNGNTFSIGTGSNSSPIITTSQFDFFKSKSVGYRYIYENMEKSKIKKDLKSKQTINETCGYEIFKLGDNMDLIKKQNNEEKMYGSIGTLITNYRQFDFMSQTLSEEEMKNLQEKGQKEEQLKSKQQELYNRYKNVHISTQDIKELHKIINEVKSIQNKEKIRTKIEKYDVKYIKLLYLISQLSKEQKKTKLQEKITIDGKICKYGYCNSNEVFGNIKQSQEAENEQYIGLVFNKESEAKDIKDMCNLINISENFIEAINELEIKETTTLTTQIKEYKTSIAELDKKLKVIQERKEYLSEL